MRNTKEAADNPLPLFCFSQTPEQCGCRKEALFFLRSGSHCTAGMQYVCEFFFRPVLSSALPLRSCWKRHSGFPCIRDACLCISSAHEPQGALGKSKQSFALAVPKLRAVRCDDKCVEHAGSRIEQAPTPFSSASKGKALPGAAGSDQEQSPTACMLSTSEQRGCPKRSLAFFRGPVFRMQNKRGSQLAAPFHFCPYDQFDAPYSSSGTS
jgi:hypothetical protein